ALAREIDDHGDGHSYTGRTFVHCHQIAGCPGADAVSRALCRRPGVRGAHRVGRLGSPGHGSRSPAAHREPHARRRRDAVRRGRAGTVAAAGRAAHDIEARLAALKRTYGAGGAGRAPSVLLQVWNRPIYTVGGRHLMSDALEICGARNVFADLPEAGPLVDTEAVIARDPDIIIAAAPPGEGAAWLADWKRFPTLAAVRSGRLVVFEDQALSRLGPSVIDASEALCRTLARVRDGGVRRGD